jgi:hypothetical protein
MGLISGQVRWGRLEAKRLETPSGLRPPPYMALAGTCYKGAPSRISILKRIALGFGVNAQGGKAPDALHPSLAHLVSATKVGDES